MYKLDYISLSDESDAFDVKYASDASHTAPSSPPRSPRTPSPPRSPTPELSPSMATRARSPSPIRSFNGDLSMTFGDGESADDADDERAAKRRKVELPAREISRAEWERGKQQFDDIAIGTRALVVMVTTSEQTVEMYPEAYVWLFVLKRLRDGWSEMVHKVPKSERFHFFDRAWTLCSGCLNEEPNQMAHMGINGCCS